MALRFAERSNAIRENSAARALAWKAGVLWWLLDANQFRAYLLIREALKTPFARYILNWARRTGKTYLLLVLVIEEMLRHKRHRYNLAAGTKEALKEFVWPSVELILETCPDSLRPKIQEHRGRITFATKSYLVLAGCNDKRSIERLRGPLSHGNIIEEMGAIPDDPGLIYIQRGVLNPQLKTTGGWNLGAGTPPKSTGSEAAQIVQQAEKVGKGYDHCTTFDCPRFSPEEHRAYMQADADLLGMTVEEYQLTADYRREWLAIIETDPEFAIIPECTPERMEGKDGKPALVREMPDVPMFRDRYVGMDLGFAPHFTHDLFAYWDFGRQVLVIEDEFQMRRLNDTALAELVKEKEKELWGEHQPFLRVSDNNWPMTISELAVVHGLVFMPTMKDELHAAIVNVRRWCRQGKIAIHPRCKELIAQLKAGVWNKQRTEFAEVKGFGHFDALAALVYLVRNVIPNQSRVPEGWGITEEHWARRGRQESSDNAALRVAFGG